MKFGKEIYKATYENQYIVVVPPLNRIIDIPRLEHPFGEQMETLNGLPPPLFAQPILYWLANIILSKAFANYKTVEQVLAAIPHNNSNFRIVEWANDKKDEPIFPR